ncbi:MAG: methyltransferase domain-containing protein [Peptococcaceae bacterium]|nr:methyltransferase domain-containing protein [Peptococcaceae bacterium]
MSKYDFEIDLTANSSTGIILNKIREDSVVLEFGCATGRMTRYMKEVLGCRVYIVEYDKDAYQTALQYAEDGLCDDIMQFQWVEKFQDINFDAIIFADVLEHLTRPEQVLEQAGHLLKEDGNIYVSIPNITHNDILMKLYDNRFDYTPTGILDDTHVHFWGLENLKQLSGKNGLYIHSIEGTSCPAGATEQYSEQSQKRTLTEPDLLINLLRERQCGEVYQFVAVFSRKPADALICRLPQQKLCSHVYIDSGQDFNAGEMLEVDAVYNGRGGYTVHSIIKNTSQIKRIKFDPVEYQSCILQTISIRQRDAELPLLYARGVAGQAGLFLPGSDPMVYVELQFPGEPVVIDAEIVLPGQSYLEQLQAEYEELSDSFKNLQMNYSRQKEQMLQQKTLYQQEIEAMYTVLQKETAHLNGLIAELQRDVNACTILANNKDNYLLHLEQKIQMLEQQVNYYQNLKVVKLRTFAARIWRGLKRRIKRLLKR